MNITPSKKKMKQHLAILHKDVAKYEMVESEESSDIEIWQVTDEYLDEQFNLQMSDKELHEFWKEYSHEPAQTNSQTKR